jgi:adenine deaminase
MVTANPPSRLGYAAAIRGLYRANALYAGEFFTQATDDRHFIELLLHGDLDYNTRLFIKAALEAIERGEISINPWRVIIDAYRAASYNAAAVLGLTDEVGSFSPGCFADVVFIAGTSLDDLAQVKVAQVIASGRLVAEGGYLKASVEPVQEPPVYALNTVALPRPVTAADFEIKAPEGRELVTAYLWQPFDFFTPRPPTVELPVVKGVVQYGTALGVYKIAVIERHRTLSPNQPEGLQLGAMFAATSPTKGRSALATTIMHDAHQISVHGNDDEAMALAVNRLVAIGGGFVAVLDGEVIAEVSLPIAGLMSNEDPTVLGEQVAALRAASDSLDWVGVKEGFGDHVTEKMTLWFLTPAPWMYNLTIQGFHDLMTGERLPVVW